MTAALLDRDTSAYRRELVAHCYRMLGSAAEAEDAVQETLVKAWSHSEDFEGRSSLRSWLYRIATHVCIDMLRAPQRRALPMDLASPSPVPTDGPVDIGAPLQDSAWVTPIADERVFAPDPADSVVTRDSVRLAFVAALQHLPARQRAVLLLRDVLAWSAAEVADLLDTSVDSVTSALARARSTLRKVDRDRSTGPLDREGAALVESYVSAFAAYDVDALVSLLREDAVFSMPPFTFWMRGTTDIERWWRGPGRAACLGSQVRTVSVNGGPAAAVYHPVEDRYDAFAVHLFEVQDGRIAAITHFLGAEVFRSLGLPTTLVA